MQKIETLEVIPSGCEQFERQFYGSERPGIVSSIPASRALHSANNSLSLQRNPAKKVLIETYGWPDSFLQGDWERDVEEVWDSIIRQA